MTHSIYPTTEDTQQARQSRSASESRRVGDLELAIRYLLENVEPLTDHQDAAFTRLRRAFNAR